VVVPVGANAEQQYHAERDRDHNYAMGYFRTRYPIDAV
jgi:hypothetical protein